jgi:hypothetical protein
MSDPHSRPPKVKRSPNERCLKKRLKKTLKDSKKAPKKLQKKKPLRREAFVRRNVDG